MTASNVDTLFKNGKLTVITFSTKDASFAIPLEQILYIEKDSKRNLQLNESSEFNHEVITFQNDAVQLLDFNNLIGTENHLSTTQKFVKKLDEMEKQHTDWLDALETSLKNNTPFTKALDPTKCAFGQWYAQFQTDNEELAELMKRFDEPHKKLHGLASELIAINKNDHDKAMSILAQERIGTLSILVRLFQLAKEHATNSVRPIIIFVEHLDSKISALRLDNIKDILEYEHKNFSIDKSTDGIMKKRPDDFNIEGFLRSGDEAPLMLINCKPGLADRDEQAEVA